MTARLYRVGPLFFSANAYGGRACTWVAVHYLHFGLRTIFVRTGIIGVSMGLTYLSEIK